MSSLSELIAKKAAEAGNPNAHVPTQNTAATSTSTDSAPQVTETIKSGIEGAISSMDTTPPVPVQTEEPDAELLEKADHCFRIGRAMPFLVTPVGAKIHPKGQFYYISAEQAEELDTATFVERGNLVQVK